MKIYVTDNKVRMIRKTQHYNNGLAVLELIRNYEKGDKEFKEWRKEQLKKNKGSNERMERSIRRTRKNMQTILEANLCENSYFVTLTNAENIQNYKQADNRFNYWIRIKNKDIKYLVIKQLQKRGAIHYHLVVFDISVSDLFDLIGSWNYGYTSYKKIDKIYPYTIANYLTQYLTNDKNQLVHNEKKIFSKSRNLKKPLIISETVVNQIFALVGRNIDLLQYDYMQHDYIIKETANERLALSIKGLGTSISLAYEMFGEKVILTE